VSGIFSLLSSTKEKEEDKGAKRRTHNNKGSSLSLCLCVSVCFGSLLLLSERCFLSLLLFSLPLSSKNLMRQILRKNANPHIFRQNVLNPHIFALLEKTSDMYS